MSWVLGFLLGAGVMFGVAMFIGELEELRTITAEKRRLERELANERAASDAGLTAVLSFLQQVRSGSGVDQLRLTEQ